MKYLLFFAFGAMPFFGFCQGVDTAAVVHKFDSLQKVWRDFRNNGKPKESLETARFAGERIGQKLVKQHARYATCLGHQVNGLFDLGNFDEALAACLGAEKGR